RVALAVVDAADALGEQRLEPGIGAAHGRYGPSCRLRRSDSSRYAASGEIRVRIPERIAASTTRRRIVSQATIRGRDFHRPIPDGKMGRVPFPTGEATGDPNRAAHEGGQGAAASLRQQAARGVD